MIKHRRHVRILGALQAEGSVELSELKSLIPDVSLVTLRRDIAELSEAGALKRTHGGAVLPDADLIRADPPHPRLVAVDGLVSVLQGMDGIILPPIADRGADALRRRIQRSGVPFIAESAAQVGGTYLGPDNAAAGRELGALAGDQVTGTEPVVLMICQTDLPNTRARSEGFELGIRSTCSSEPEFIRVNGQGSYRQSLRVAQDALKVRPDISIIFGVNDHAALAGIDAAECAGADVAVYATGGESPSFVGRLAEDGMLRAVAAFFPDVVGAMGIDILVKALRGDRLPGSVMTPHAIIAPHSLADHYTRNVQGHWELRPERVAALLPAITKATAPDLGDRSIGFMPHYPAHDWYRIMIQAMTARAKAYGISLVVSPPHQGIAAEISRLRAEIARAALDRLEPGQTVILGDGEACLCLADEIRRAAATRPDQLHGVTVITNALDVLHRLEHCQTLKVILTSGEYQKADRCLVGPSLGALFERMRADLAFLAPSGVSPDFGISSVDERLALANSRLVEAARRTIVLADHTSIGVDANHRIARPGGIQEVITDDGTLPTDRQKLRDVGIDVLIAGETTDETPTAARPKAARSS
ncbi:MAG: substrate-binding domain-containing protein [Pseudomonadota bacterium]